MADRTQVSEASILATIFQNKVASQINRACVGFQYLPKRPLDPGAQNITWDIKSGSAGSSGTAPIADGANATNIGVSTLGKASLNVVTYHKGFSVTRLATFLANWSGNPSDLKNIKIKAPAAPPTYLVDGKEVNAAEATVAERRRDERVDLTRLRLGGEPRSERAVGRFSCDRLRFAADSGGGYAIVDRDLHRRRLGAVAVWPPAHHAARRYRRKL